MSRKCFSIAFKLRAVAVTEAQSYLFPSVASGCSSYKCRSRINARTKSASKMPGLVIKDLWYVPIGIWSSYLKSERLILHTCELQIRLVTLHGLHHWTRRNYVGQTRACSKSVLDGKIRPVPPLLFISTRLKNRGKKGWGYDAKRKRKTTRISAWPFSKDCSGVMKMRQLTLTDDSGDGRRKKNKSGEDGSYWTAQVSHGDGRRKKSKTEEHGSYHSAEVSPWDRGRKKS